MATEVTSQANKPLTTGSSGVLYYMWYDVNCSANDAPVAVVKDDEDDQGDDGEDDEDEVLEAHGRWQKIAEQVQYWYRFCFPL